MYNDASSSQDLLKQKRGCSLVEDSHVKTNLVFIFRVRGFDLESPDIPQIPVQKLKLL